MLGETRERDSGSSAYQACYARYRQALKRHLESAVAGCPESESAVADAKFDPDNYHARFRYVQPREGHNTLIDDGPSYGTLTDGGRLEVGEKGAQL